MQIVSAEETRRLRAAARGNRLEALYVLAVTAGLRQGELLALKWQDVDLENAALSVRRTVTKSGGRLLLGEPKTKASRRTISLTGGAVRALRGHLAKQMEEIGSLGDLYRDDGLVFASGVGTRAPPPCPGGVPAPRYSRRLGGYMRRTIDALIFIIFPQRLSKERMPTSGRKGKEEPKRRSRVLLIVGAQTSNAAGQNPRPRGRRLLCRHRHLSAGALCPPS